MNIIAITPFTGDENLVAMTERCIKQFIQSEMPVGVHVRIIAVNNKASRSLNLEELNKIAQDTSPAFEKIEELPGDENYGFGVGVNRGIDYALISERYPCDQLLIFNNDLEFDWQKEWLLQLLREVEGAYVLSPRTDITATVEACHIKPDDKPSQRVQEVSAFCWLVPRRVVQAIDVRWGFPLFCPQFTNYGSDDATAAILRKLYGDTPFKVVHRAWVRHLKARTANQLHIKAGTSELLKELRTWKKANKLT